MQTALRGFHSTETVPEYFYCSPAVMVSLQGYSSMQSYTVIRHYSPAGELHPF